MDTQGSKLERAPQGHCRGSNNICEKLESFLNVVLRCVRKIFFYGHFRCRGGTLLRKQKIK